MINEKTYKKEIVRMWDSIRDDEYKGMDVCSGVYCNKKCALYGVNEISKPICCDVVDAFQQIKAIEKWSKEHPPKKYKVSKLEYDIMRAAIDYSSEEEAFKDVDILYELLINGYFSGAKSSDKVIDFFKNCEVVDD